MTDLDGIVAAAKAAYPELWPEDEKKWQLGARAALVHSRQAVIERVTNAVEAYEQATASTPPQVFEIQLPSDAAMIQLPSDAAMIQLPSDAAMIQQVLTVIAYLDGDGQTAYSVRTTGEGLISSWLGMCVLAQDYLLHLQRNGQGGRK
mgnify:CR=1 FL=1